MEQNSNMKASSARHRWMKRAGQVIVLGMLNGMATGAGGLVVAALTTWAGMR